MCKGRLKVLCMSVFDYHVTSSSFFSICLYVSISWFASTQVPHPSLPLRGWGAHPWRPWYYHPTSPLFPRHHTLLIHTKLSSALHSHHDTHTPHDLLSVVSALLVRLNVPLCFCLYYWDLFIKTWTSFYLIDIMYCLFLFSNVKMYVSNTGKGNRTLLDIGLSFRWVAFSKKSWFRRVVSLFEIKTSGMFKMPLIYE